MTGYLSKFTLLNDISVTLEHVHTGNYTIVVSFFSFPQEVVFSSEYLKQLSNGKNEVH